VPTTTAGALTPAMPATATQPARAVRPLVATASTSDAALPRVTPRQAPANSTVTLQREGGTAVMTNSGPTASSTYEAKAREFAANATGNYTIQLAIICEPSNLAKSSRTGGAEIWYVPMSYRGRSCYKLFFGRYDTQAAARAAVAGVPASLRASSPAVVRVPKG
jgi:septal ring-binding cell division protein DamX